jgi:hypothetical protein
MEQSVPPGVTRGHSDAGGCHACRIHDPHASPGRRRYRARRNPDPLHRGLPRLRPDLHRLCRCLPGGRHGRATAAMHPPRPGLRRSVQGDRHGGIAAHRCEPDDFARPAGGPVPKPAASAARNANAMARCMAIAASAPRPAVTASSSAARWATRSRRCCSRIAVRVIPAGAPISTARRAGIPFYCRLAGKWDPGSRKGSAGVTIFGCFGSKLPARVSARRSRS